MVKVLFIINIVLIDNNELLIDLKENNVICIMLEMFVSYSDKNGWIIDMDVYFVKLFDYEGLKLDRDVLKVWGY